MISLSSLAQVFQIGDVLCSASEDIESSLCQQVQPPCRDFLSVVGFFKQSYDITAQSTRTPGPVGIRRETFQAGYQKAQELGLVRENLRHEGIIPSELDRDEMRLAGWVKLM